MLTFKEELNLAVEFIFTMVVVTIPVPIVFLLLSSKGLEIVYIWLGWMALVIWVVAVSIPIHRFFENN